VDVQEIDAASNGGIDEIRELREAVRYLPARDRHKVFIIDEAHMLTTEAFNALLKTLEEPPPRSLFILATTEPHKLASTIQSRCQHFAFRLLDYTEIFARLQSVAGAEKIQVIAACGEHLEEKRVRQVLGVVPTQLLNETLQAIHAADPRRVLEQVGRLASEGYELAHFCGELARAVRDLMVAKSCGAESGLLQVPDSQRPKLAELAGLFSEEDLSRFFQILLRTESEMRYSLQPRFHLELGLMKLVHARRLASLESLLGELRGSGSTEKAPPARPPSAATAPARTKPLEAQKTAAPGADTRLPQKPREAAGEISRAAGVSAGVTEDTRLTAIKSLLFDQSKKFLSSCLEHLAGWRFEDGEVRFLYGKSESWAADFLNTREQLEALRAACAQVLGQPVRICVTLQEQGLETQVARLSARERAEQDAGVEVFRKRFDCTLVEVKDLNQE
jgi:DNA polymerase-3 subunit gamma/tau